MITQKMTAEQIEARLKLNIQYKLTDAGAVAIIDGIRQDNILSTSPEWACFEAWKSKGNTPIPQITEEEQAELDAQATQKLIDDAEAEYEAVRAYFEVTHSLGVFDFTERSHTDFDKKIGRNKAFDWKSKDNTVHNLTIAQANEIGDLIDTRLTTAYFALQAKKAEIRG